MLSLATKIASLSECRMKHATILVRSGSILAIATNKHRNSPETMSLEPDKVKKYTSVHSEIAAITKTPNAKGAVAYVARVNRSGDHRMSKPCQPCQIALEEAGIRKIIYTTEGDQ